MRQIYSRAPSFHSLEAAKFRTKREREIAKIITGDIATQQWNEGEPVFINLHGKYGAARIGCSKRGYYGALKALLDQDYLITDNHYIKGKKAKGYQITEKLITEGFKWRTYTVNQVGADQMQQSFEENPDTEAQLAHFPNLRPDWMLSAALGYMERKQATGHITAIDYDLFYKHIKTPQQLSEAIEAVITISDELSAKDRFFLIGELKWRFIQLHDLRQGTLPYQCHQSTVNDRIYSTLTQIPREFRKAMRVQYTGEKWTKWGHPAELAPYNGKEMTEVDVKNAQPCLLAALLTKEGVRADDLLKDTTEGKFHGLMMQTLGIEPSEKDITYKPALFHFLYGRHNDPTRKEFKAAFRALYGSEATNWIESHKREHGHHELPIIMQKMEAAAMIYRAARRVRHLFPSAPVITVHDSLMIPHEEKIIKAAVKAVKGAFFDLYGLNVTVTHELRGIQ